MPLSRLLDLAVQIQQIPAPTFHEEKRARFMREQWNALGLPTEEDETGNVYALLRGKKRDRTVVLSAHLDTVFPADTPLRLRRDGKRIIGPGIGDNSLALAALVEVARTVTEGSLTLQGDVWLTANVGEEGLGNLRGMRAVADRFGGAPLAYLVLEGMSLGVIYHRALSVQRYRITARTEGGHSWANYGVPSAIHELARLIAQLDALALPRSPRTSLNAGVFRGGVSVNTIAPQAWTELDLRSESPEMLAWLSRQVNLLVGQANRPGVKVTLENIGQRPGGAIPAAHPLVRAAEECLREQGISPALFVGSTDANIPLSRGYPAICVGLTKGGRAHTEQEYIATAPLEQGMAFLYALLKRVWTLDGSREAV